jgi:parallel beta-helix repeat protein
MNTKRAYKNRLFPSRMAFAILAVMALLVCAGRAGATDISGNISTTVTITDNSQLVGDVTCAVPLTVSGANPCIAFGADHIQLSLNGHTITGPVDAPTDPASCSFPSDSMFGVGILANGRTGVKIEGPGVVQKFQRWGILLLSSDHVTVRNVTATRNCWSGMQTIGTSDSEFEKDIWVNNAAGSHGAACGGICLVNSNDNRMRKSTFYGNGSLDYANGNVDFGVGFEGSSSANRVEKNDIGGNTNGIEFFNTSTDNVVRRNIVVGNPAAQVIKSFTASNQQGADIAFRPSFTGANNVFGDNFCLTYVQGGGPANAPCPNVITEGVEEAANRLISVENSLGLSRAKKAVHGAPIFSLMLVILAAAFARLALG